MSQLQQEHAPAAGADAAGPFVLEAHTYSEGLRVKVLGRNAERPAWTPPADYVGFRDEVNLQLGDYAVEFARFLYRSRKVTWIALFKRAIDEVYGDRQNHAGAGLWLLEHDIIYAEPLLMSLRIFADLAAQGAALDDHADKFRAAQLSQYFQPSLNLPGPLSGWAFAPGRGAQSSTFHAAKTDDRTAWKLAGDQVLRMTLLPPPTPGHARAVILVREEASEVGRAPEAGAAAALTAPELMKLLPGAFQAISEEGAAARQEAERVAALFRQREAEMAEAERRIEALQERAAAAEHEAARVRGELEQNEPARQYAALRASVRELADCVQSGNSDLVSAQHEILRRIGSLNQSSVGRAEVDRGRLPGSSSSHVARLDLARGRTPANGTLPTLYWVIGGVVLVAFLVVLFLMAWTRWQAAPSPAAETSITTR